MGVKCASSLNMGEKLPQESYVITCKNIISGHIQCKTHLLYPELSDVE